MAAGPSRSSTRARRSPGRPLRAAPPANSRSTRPAQSAEGGKHRLQLARDQGVGPDQGPAGGDQAQERGDPAHAARVWIGGATGGGEEAHVPA